MKNRSLPRDIPASPRTGMHPGTKVLLAVAFVLHLLLIALFQIGGTHRVFVYAWVYPAAFTLSISSLVMLLVPLFRRLAKTSLAKNILTALVLILVMVVLTAGWSFVALFQGMGISPAAFSTSPNGKNTVVLLRSYDLENAKPDTDADEIYSLCPMDNALFYRPIENGELHDPTNPHPNVAIEWIDDHNARAYFTETPGADVQSELFVTFK